MHQHTAAEKIAASMLTRDGVAAIWQLQLAAADAYRTGHPRSAEVVLEVATAAEEAWLSARERLRERLFDLIGEPVRGEGSHGDFPVIGHTQRAKRPTETRA